MPPHNARDEGASRPDRRDQPDDFDGFRQLALTHLGPIYKAHQRTTDDACVVSILGGLISDDVTWRRFRDDCGGYRVLVDVPHVAAPANLGVTRSGRPWLQYPYSAGDIPASRLMERRPAPLVNIAIIVLQVASALDAMHQQGLLHLDVRPENLLIGRDGTTLLINPGVGRAIAVADPLGPAATAPTRLEHAPRELLGWEEPGPAADVYSLGSTCYALLSGGHLPYGTAAVDGDSEVYTARLTGEPRPLPVPERSAARLPPDVEALLIRMLAPDPGNRPRLPEVVDAFGRLVPDKPDPGRFNPPASRPESKISGNAQATSADPSGPTLPAGRPRQLNGLISRSVRIGDQVPWWTVPAVVSALIMVILLLALDRGTGGGSGPHSKPTASTATADPDTRAIEDVITNFLRDTSSTTSNLTAAWALLTSAEQERFGAKPSQATSAYPAGWANRYRNSTSDPPRFSSSATFDAHHESASINIRARRRTRSEPSGKESCYDWRRVYLKKVNGGWLIDKIDSSNSAC